MHETTVQDRVIVKAQILGEHLSTDHEPISRLMTVRPRQWGWLPWRVRRRMLWKLDAQGSLWIDKDGVLYREYWNGIGRGSYCMTAELDKMDERRLSRILGMLENPSVVDWS